MNKLFLPVFGVLCALAGVSCNNKEFKGEAASLSSSKTFPVYQINSQDIVLDEDYVAEINAVQNVEIRSRVKGFLDKIYVDEGKKVKKGQLLFSISDDLYQSEVAKARANTQIAIAEAKASEITMNNMKMLVDKGVVNKTEWELAKAKYQSLQAKVEEAKANQLTAEINLSHAHVKAPFDGVIDRFPFKVGSVIDEGALLTSLSDVSSMHVYFKISEMEYLAFMKQKDFLNQSTAQLVLADGSLHEEQGKIETIEGDFDKTTGTIAIRASFPNTQRILKHGSSGRVRLSNKAIKTLLIPQKATFDIQDKVFVYELLNDNTVRSLAVKPQRRYGEFFIVNDPILQGKRIVLEGIQLLKEGQKISPKMVNDEEVKNGLLKN
jgi:membrane fusion protein (multidrug efflux system)